MIRRGISVLFLTVALCTMGATFAADQWDMRDGFSQVARNVMPAVVSIRVEKTITPQSQLESDPLQEEFLRRFFGPQFQAPQGRVPREYRQEGQGSGFILTKDGYILTNSHVVGDADKVTVKLKDGRKFQAVKTWSDPKSEVAIIKVEAEDLPTLALGKSSNLDIGEWVIAVGNPFGLSATLTVGVVSAKGRNNIGIADYEDFIQTDAAINPGNSGGPLLNIDGEVVGINTAIYSRSGGYMGIGFAIPVDMAVAIKDRLLADGKVDRGFIGISMNPTPVTEEMAQAFGLDKPGGVLIADVLDEGPAGDAGLQAGDVILEINGLRVTDNASFRNRVAMTIPGTEVALAIVRDGKSLEVKLKVGSLPDRLGGGVKELDSLSEKLGITVQPLTEELAKQLDLDTENGVLISEVQPDSPAADARLAPGQVILEVNRIPTPNTDAFNKALKAAIDEEHILLRVKARTGTWFALVRID